MRYLGCTKCHYCNFWFKLKRLFQLCVESSISLLIAILFFWTDFMILVIMKLWASANNVTHGQSLCTKKCFYVWLYWPTLNYEQKIKRKRFLSVFCFFVFQVCVTRTYAEKRLSGRSRRYFGILSPQTNWRTSSQNVLEFRQRRSKDPDLKQRKLDKFLKHNSC